MHGVFPPSRHPRAEFWQVGTFIVSKCKTAGCAGHTERVSSFFSHFTPHLSADLLVRNIDPRMRRQMAGCYSYVCRGLVTGITYINDMVGKFYPVTTMVTPILYFLSNPVSFDMEHCPII